MSSGFLSRYRCNDIPLLAQALVMGLGTLIWPLVVLMAITKTFIAPHFVDVQHGVRQLDDWGVDNCLGPKP